LKRNITREETIEEVGTVAGRVVVEEVLAVEDEG
jgi:hypothetical protein